MAIGIDLKGIGEIFSGAGKFAGDMRSAITGDISAEKKAELEIKMQEFEAAAMNAQAEINKVEASSASLFVAGARPAILWIGALVILYSYVIAPILKLSQALEYHLGGFAVPDIADYPAHEDSFHTCSP